MIDKILLYIRRGYGLNQLMEALQLERKDVLAFMEKDNSFKNKMLKRFPIDWLKSEEETPVTATEVIENTVEFNERADNAFSQLQSELVAPIVNSIVSELSPGGINLVDSNNIPDRATLERDANVLGIVFNARIGDVKLFDRIKEYLEANPDKNTLIDPDLFTEGGVVINEATVITDDMWEALNVRVNTLGLDQVPESYKERLAVVEELEKEAKSNDQ